VISSVRGNLIIQWHSHSWL